MLRVFYRNRIFVNCNGGILLIDWSNFYGDCLFVALVNFTKRIVLNEFSPN